jgi:hypothetical protein
MASSSIDNVYSCEHFFYTIQWLNGRALPSYKVCGQAEAAGSSPVWISCSISFW